VRLQVGYEFGYHFPQPTPCILTLNIHYSRVGDLEFPDHIVVTPPTALSGYREEFGNWCSRLVAPAGRVRIVTSSVVRDTGQPDPVFSDARQVPVEYLPDETLVFLLASRFCESDKLLDMSWELFGKASPGWGRVQAICDFVHNHIAFNYENASSTRTASEAYREGRGVCRDYAHLAIAFCRALNIPVRYCTGYLGDVGTQPPFPPGDFAAWFEAYLDGCWHTFDPRNNTPRVGRVLIARGRDAADVAMVTTFGPNTLEAFHVWTNEIREAGNGNEKFRLIAPEAFLGPDRV
jgi:transglutaminase-like putative cysteine protease